MLNFYVLFCMFPTELSVFVFNGLFCQGVLELNPICFVCNIFSLNISSHHTSPLHGQV